MAEENKTDVGNEKMLELLMAKLGQLQGGSLLSGLNGVQYDVKLKEISLYGELKDGDRSVSINCTFDGTGIKPDQIEGFVIEVIRQGFPVKVKTNYYNNKNSNKFSR